MKNIAQHILDIAHNAISAESTLIDIYILKSHKKNLLELLIKDDGKGMSKEMLDKVADPYTTSRTTRKVGMGIPLLKQNAEQSAGKFSISSAEKKGTMVNASFQLDHLDTPPMGHVVDSVVGLATSQTEIDFIFTYMTDHGEFIFSTKDVKEALEGTPMHEPQVTRYLKEMIIENIEEYCGEKLR